MSPATGGPREPPLKPATVYAMTEYNATEALQGSHLRAARAMLGWAMTDLARASGLSLSTIRRLEQDARAVSVRNRRSAVEALRLGGIRFLALQDGSLALAEPRPRRGFYHGDGI